VSSFFSEIFGFSLRLHGLPEAAKEVIVRGDFAAREAIGFYLSDGDRLVAALTVGQPDEVNDGLKELLRTQARVERDKLADAGVAIPDLASSD
jgi:hypothetical protein